MVSFDFAIDTDWPVAFHTKKVQLDSWVDGTVADNFGFFCEFSPFMFVL